MFCVECGQKMDDGAKFCSNCGKPLNRAGNVSGEQAGAAGAASAEKTQAPSSIMLPDIPGETMKASSAAISSDGKYLAVIIREGDSRTYELHIIDTQSGEKVRSIVRKEHYRGDPEELWAVSSNGGFVVIDDEGMVNTETGNQIHLDIKGPVCFSPDSKRLAYYKDGYSSEHLIIITVPKGDTVMSIDLEGYSISSIAYSPDKCFLAVGYYHHGTSLWDARNGSKIFEQENGPIKSVAFSPDGSRIVTAGLHPDDNPCVDPRTVICILDAKSGDVLLKFEDRAMKDVGNVRFSPDGSAIVVCESDGDIKIINAETGEVLRQLHADGLKWASYTPDGKKFISFSNTSNILLRGESFVKYWVSE